jgi:hypothetical protein
MIILLAMLNSFEHGWRRERRKRPGTRQSALRHQASLAWTCHAVEGKGENAKRAHSPRQSKIQNTRYGGIKSDRNSV